MMISSQIKPFFEVKSEKSTPFFENWTNIYFFRQTFQIDIDDNPNLFSLHSVSQMSSIKIK